jgi:transposase
MAKRRLAEHRTRIDAQGTTVLRKRLRRGQVLAFFSRIPRCVVGLEACATAHYSARLAMRYD